MKSKQALLFPLESAVLDEPCGWTWQLCESSELCPWELELEQGTFMPCPSSTVKIQRKKYSVAALFLPRLSGNQWEEARRGHSTNNGRRKSSITLGWCVETAPDRRVGGSGGRFGWFPCPRCPCAPALGVQGFPVTKLPHAAGTWSQRTLRGVFSWSLPAIIQR